MEITSILESLKTFLISLITFLNLSIYKKIFCKNYIHSNKEGKLLMNICQNSEYIPANQDSAIYYKLYTSIEKT